MRAHAASRRREITLQAPAVPGASFEVRASVLRRVAAYACDMAWLWVVLMAVQFALQLGVVGENARWRASGTWLELWTLATISLPAWLLLAACDASASGATPGKRLLRIRAVAADGGRIPFGRAVLRNIVKLAPWETAHLSINLPRNPFVDPDTGAFTGFSSGDGFRPAMLAPYLVAAVWLLVAARGRAVHDRVAGTDVVAVGLSRPSSPKLGRKT